MSFQAKFVCKNLWSSKPPYQPHSSDLTVDMSGDVLIIRGPFCLLVMYFPIFFFN